MADRICVFCSLDYGDIKTWSYKKQIIAAHKACLDSQDIPWGVKMYRLGRCANCGDPRGDSPYKRFCIACRKRRSAKERKYHGSSAWREGKKGRRPLYLEQERRTSL